MKAVLIALFALALFIVAFVLFMLAPLIMMLIVGFGMFGVERSNRRRRLRGVLERGEARPLPRAAGSTRQAADDSAFGFGALAGEDL